MDLADIRKKARLQDEQPIASQADDHSLQPAAVEIGEVSREESLENFWQDAAALALTTEEEYANGLASHGQEGEEKAVQWLTFSLGVEEYALELSSVQELIKPRHLTELPKVPDYLLGIVSLRGVIVPVIDLGRRLSLPSSHDESQQRVIVCASGEQRFGLLVDRVNSVVRINPDQVESSPLLADAPAKDFVAGVGRVDSRMLIYLDLERVTEIEGQGMALEG